MISPICPVCGVKLDIAHTPWRCKSGHTYDMARQGYVNLLLANQKHALHPGDTRDQVAARQRFLDGGFYAPIQAQVIATLQPQLPEKPAVLDAGCGEGYYGAAVAEQLQAELWGVDISKDAVRYAAVRCKQAHWITASAAHLPFSDGSFDAVLSMFSLTMAGEFSRVLKPGGLFLQVLAGEDHLLGLKQIIYPELLRREKQHSVPEGFIRLDHRVLEFSFDLETSQQVADLLAMTPHFWRITKEGAQAAAGTNHLHDMAQVIFNLYRVKL